MATPLEGRAMRNRSSLLLMPSPSKAFEIPDNLIALATETGHLFVFLLASLLFLILQTQMLLKFPSSHIFFSLSTGVQNAVGIDIALGDTTHSEYPRLQPRFSELAFPGRRIWESAFLISSLMNFIWVKRPSGKHRAYILFQGPHLPQNIQQSPFCKQLSEHYLQNRLMFQTHIPSVLMTFPFGGPAGTLHFVYPEPDILLPPRYQLFPLNSVRIDCASLVVWPLIS